MASAWASPVDAEGRLTDESRREDLAELLAALAREIAAAPTLVAA